jgi:hypothetical protein
MADRYHGLARRQLPGSAEKFVREAIARRLQSVPVVACFYSVRDLPYALDGGHDAEGHHDSALTQKTYVHASDEDLQRGQAALARIHKIV